MQITPPHFGDRTSAPHAPSDAVLVQRAQHGDTRAIATLYERYHQQAYGYLHEHAPVHLVNDLDQELWLRAMERLWQLDSNDQVYFRAWLFTIARNLIVDYHRLGEQRYRGPSLDQPISHQNHEGYEIKIWFDVADHSVTSPEYHVTLSELREALREALACLTPANRRLFLAQVAGTSYDELAKHEGVSAVAIKTRLHRIRTKLQCVLSVDSRVTSWRSARAPVPSFDRWPTDHPVPSLTELRRAREILELSRVFISRTLGYCDTWCKDVEAGRSASGAVEYAAALEWFAKQRGTGTRIRREQWIS